MIKKFYEYYSDNIKLFLDSIEKFRITVDEYDDEVHGESNNVKWLQFDKKEKHLLNEFLNIKIKKYSDNNYICNILDLTPLQMTIVKLTDDYYYVFICKSCDVYYYKLDQITELKYFIKNIKKYLKR